MLVFLSLAGEVMEGETLAFDKRIVQAFRKADNPALPVGPPWISSVLLDVTAEPAPQDDGLVRYVVLLGNEGRSTSARATVAATLPGDAAPGLHTRAVRALAPGKHARVTFVGPGCPAGAAPASFLADPSNAVEEASETNNALAAACPAP